MAFRGLRILAVFAASAVLFGLVEASPGRQTAASIRNSLGSASGNDSRRLEASAPKLLEFQALEGPMVARGVVVHLRVSAKGESLRRRWFFNGALLPTADTLLSPGTYEMVVTNFSAKNAGLYAVTLENQWGRVASAEIPLGISAWRQCAFPDADGWFSAGISTDGQRLMAASYSHLMLSGDGGRLWSDRSPAAGLSAATLSADSAVLALGFSDAPREWSLAPIGDWQPRVCLPPGATDDASYRTFHGLACNRDGGIMVAASQGNYDNGQPYGTFKGFAYVSQDRGASWTLGMQTPETHIIYSPACSADGQIQAVCSWRFYSWTWMLYLSTNAGASWKSIAMPADAQPESVAVSPDGAALALCSQTNLYLSWNLGVSWQLTPAPAQQWLTVCFGSGSRRLYAAGLVPDLDRGLIYASVDAGQTWRWSGSPSAAWSCLACAGDGERVIAAAREGVFLSPFLTGASSIGAQSQISIREGKAEVSGKAEPHETCLLRRADALSQAAWMTLGAITADGTGRFNSVEPMRSTEAYWQVVLPP